jgi:hypothetical protein
MKNLIKKFNEIYVWRVIVNKKNDNKFTSYHDSYADAYSRYFLLENDFKVNSNLERCSLWFSLNYRLNKYFKLDF